MAPAGDGPPTSIHDFAFPANRAGGTIAAATLASPMSIGVPAGPDHAPIVIDMATEFGVASSSDNTRALLKQLGLQAAVVALGGVMAGVYSEPEALPGGSPWEANQGSFIIVMDASKFLPDGGAAMGTFVAKASALAPLPGLARAELPGTDQVRRIAHCERHGIALEPGHHGSLLELARELRVPVPPAIAHGQATTPPSKL